MSKIAYYRAAAQDQGTELQSAAMGAALTMSLTMSVSAAQRDGQRCRSFCGLEGQIVARC